MKHKELIGATDVKTEEQTEIAEMVPRNRATGIDDTNIVQTQFKYFTHLAPVFKGHTLDSA